MNFGERPYDDCDAFISVGVPDKTPAFTRFVCNECDRVVWYKLSRIDPVAYTESQFLRDFDVDEETMKIIDKNKN